MELLNALVSTSFMNFDGLSQTIIITFELNILGLLLLIKNNMLFIIKINISRKLRRKLNSNKDCYCYKDYYLKFAKVN